MGMRRRPGASPTCACGGELLIRVAEQEADQEQVVVFRQVLVANRGESEVRAFRAASELGAGTVAVFPKEDRSLVHRLKAGESYQIGALGHPVLELTGTRRGRSPRRGTPGCRCAPRPRRAPTSSSCQSPPVTCGSLRRGAGGDA